MVYHDDASSHIFFPPLPLLQPFMSSSLPHPMNDDLLLGPGEEGVSALTTQAKDLLRAEIQSKPPLIDG